MDVRSELRKEAYKYVLQTLGSLTTEPAGKNWIHLIPLDELRLVKEGIADPSPALVALVKDLVQGVISDDAVDSHLVTPFENYKPE